MPALQATASCLWFEVPTLGSRQKCELRLDLLGPAHGSILKKLHSYGCDLKYGKMEYPEFMVALFTCRNSWTATVHHWGLVESTVDQRVDCSSKVFRMRGPGICSSEEKCVLFNVKETKVGTKIYCG
jgi:hypothetical protein